MEFCPNSNKHLGWNNSLGWNFVENCTYSRKIEQNCSLMCLIIYKSIKFYKLVWFCVNVCNFAQNSNRDCYSIVALKKNSVLENQTPLEELNVLVKLLYIMPCPNIALWVSDDLRYWAAIATKRDLLIQYKMYFLFGMNGS